MIAKPLFPTKIIRLRNLPFPTNRHQVDCETTFSYTNRHQLICENPCSYKNQVVSYQVVEISNVVNIDADDVGNPQLVRLVAILISFDDEQKLDG